MPSFDEMKRKYSKVTTLGEQYKIMADQAIQDTFDNDLQARQCYIYDYHRDDQSELEYGYDPSLSKTKIPVKLKFIIKTYKSIAKDDPEYHIMFEPNVWNSMSCKPDWFVNNYEKFGVNFPVGLYVDIPDDRGVYHKWLIMYKEVANQFPKFGVVKCNYRFSWVNNKNGNRYIRKVWGVEVTQNSYTSGIYTDYKMTRFEEQGKFYLPWNTITLQLKHDTRLIISMLQEEPYVYKITKVQNTSPKGIINFTVKQDRFDLIHDYVCIDQNDDKYGEMLADYYITNVIPETENTDNTLENRMLISSANSILRIGAYKIINVIIYDKNNEEITNQYSDSIFNWEFNLAGESTDLVTIDSEYSKKVGNEFKCKFMFTGNEKYINENLIVTCSAENMSSSITLNISAL